MKVRLTITAEPHTAEMCDTAPWPNHDPPCAMLDCDGDWCLACRVPLTYDPARHGYLRCPECLAGEVVE